MRYVDRLIHWFAAALSTTLGFIAIFATLIAGFIVGLLVQFDQEWSLLFNMYLSLAAIVIAAAILIAQRRDTNAIQAKLDQILLSGDADRRLVGIERNTVQEIEDIRTEQHGVLDGQ